MRDVGLALLALAALSGWLVLLGTEWPDVLRRWGIRHPARIRQTHLDWVMMGLILLAVWATVPDLPVTVVLFLSLSVGLPATFVFVAL